MRPGDHGPAAGGRITRRQEVGATARRGLAISADRRVDDALGLRRTGQPELAGQRLGGLHGGRSGRGETTREDGQAEQETNQGQEARGAHGAP